MTTLRQRTAAIREKRIGSIAAYSGTLGSLLREAQEGPLPQRVRTFSQDFPSDLQHAFDVLLTLEGVAIVVHGPAGCAAWLRGRAQNWVATGLTERDSILGGDSRLREAIIEAHARFAPRLILVFATPVVAINNDDIESVTTELRDTLGLPIVPVYTDGFRSKLGSSGQDVAVHALLKHLVPIRPRPRGDGINLLAVRESTADLAHLRALLATLALESRSFPHFADPGQLEHIAAARLSVAIDGDSADYAGTLLEASYGVPFLNPGLPLGLAGTARWLEAIGTATGREEASAALIARQSASVRSLIAAHAPVLDGAAVYINLPHAAAFAFAQLAQELGLKVVGLKLPHIAHRDAATLEAALDQLGDIPLLIGEGQVFEEANELRKLRPALYVSQGTAAVHATRLGIAVLDLANLPTLGYAGLSALIDKIARRLAHRSLQDFLAAGSGDRYASGWLAKRAHWYIKHEVK